MGARALRTWHGPTWRPCGDGFDQSAALSILDAIANVASGKVQCFVNRMPPDWMTADLQAQFLDVRISRSCIAQ